MNDASERPGKVNLAQEADFDLGGLRISPSACKVANGGGEERVEPRVMEVLVVLFRNAGRTVPREQLIDACWEGRAVSDDAVTRVIARVRALGRNADPPHFTLETIPKVGFRLAGNGSAVEGVPPAVPPSRKFNTSAVVAAVTATVAFVIAAVWLATGREAAKQAVPDRVAVVAFATLGPEPELVTLARKAQDAVVQRITEVGTPVVLMAPSSAKVEAPEIRLQSSVERSGDRYAIRAALIVEPKGLALWSERFERKAADLPGLEEEVAYAIAYAFSACRKGYAADSWQGADEDLLPILFEDCFADGTLDVERQAAAARRLVEAKPNLAMAHGRLALALAQQSVAFAHLPEQTKALGDAALAAANKALDLDSKDVSAHLALGSRTGMASLADRERHLMRAHELDPQNVRLLRQYGKFLLEVGRRAAARETFGRAERWPSTAIYRAFIDGMNGDRVSAERQLQQLAVVRPAWARGGRWVIAAFWEDPRVAISKLPGLSAAQPGDGDPCIIAHVGFVARAAGRPIIGLPQGCEGLDIDWRVRLLARQGDVDGAFALLNGPWPVTRPHMFLFYPELKSVRADRRFLALAKRLGLLDYWRETQRWPDFCTESGLPYDCRGS